MKGIGTSLPCTYVDDHTHVLLNMQTTCVHTDVHTHSSVLNKRQGYSHDCFANVTALSRGDAWLSQQELIPPVYRRAGTGPTGREQHARGGLALCGVSESRVSFNEAIMCPFRVTGPSR